MKPCNLGGRQVSVSIDRKDNVGVSLCDWVHILELVGVGEIKGCDGRIVFGWWSSCPFDWCAVVGAGSLYGFAFDFPIGRLWADATISDSVVADVDA